MSESENQKHVELVVCRGTRCGDRDVKVGDKITVPADDIENGIYPARWWIKTGKALPPDEATAVIKAQKAPAEGK